MRHFDCPQCGTRVFFENVACLSCGTALGYLPQDGAMHRAVGPTAANGHPRSCANRAQGVCNWLVPATDSNDLCRACRLTRTRPDPNLPGNLRRWAAAEVAKRRLLYGFDRCGLDAAGEYGEPMLFDLLADPAARSGGMPEVRMGHKAGLITINLEEADPLHRERSRTALDEPYRTLLGHFRHESGHWFWPRLVGAHPARLDAFRCRFGDERNNYEQALQNHNAQGVDPARRREYVSDYAAAHPHEDWAETWAHLLHMLDVLDTATNLGLGLARDQRLPDDWDPWREQQLQLLLDRFIPMTEALNELNRSMGLTDAYPFVITPAVQAKLEFAHQVVIGAA